MAKDNRCDYCGQKLGACPTNGLTHTPNLGDLRDLVGKMKGGKDARAKRAAAVLLSYADHMGPREGGDGEETELMFADLLTDLRHLADTARISWDEGLRRVDRDYGYETAF